MAKKRQTTHLFKRSNISGKVPSSGDLLLGEVALNTADVILYASGTTANSILPIGWDRVNLTGDTMTGQLNVPTVSATTVSATTYYGDGSNLANINTVVGGSYSLPNETLTLNRNVGPDININGFEHYRLFTSGGTEELIIQDNGDIHHNAYSVGRDDGVTPYSANTYYNTNGDLQVGQARSFLIGNSGRVYCYTDNRWVTESDSGYGSNYYQFRRTGGTGVNPIIRYHHLGFMIPKGKFIKNLTVTFRSNSSQVTDMQIQTITKRPTNLADWDTGLVNATPLTNDVLSDVTFMGVGWGTSLTRLRKKVIPLNYLVPEDVFLSIYFKPIGTMTATRYVYTTFNFEII